MNICELMHVAVGVTTPPKVASNSLKKMQSAGFTCLGALYGGCEFTIGEKMGTNKSSKWYSFTTMALNS